MRALAEFTKTTLIGGVLIVLPVYLSVLLLVKAIAGISGLVAPIADGLPAALQFPQLIAVLLLIVACFACGIAVRTGPGLRAKNAIEHSLLEKIPGYTLIRGLAGRVVGNTEEETFTVVLAEIEEALVPAFLVEDCDEQHCTIFVPSVPTPAAGAIYIIAKERVHRVDVSFATAVRVISKWGAGSSELLARMQARQSTGHR